MRVVVVDDESDTVESLGMLFEMNGDEVLKLESAEGLVAALTSFGPDVLLMDLAMPEVDGLQAIRSVRRAPAPVASVPAVAISGMARTADELAAIRAGFDQHVSKPAHFADVLRAISVARHARKLNGREPLVRERACDGHSPREPVARERLSLLPGASSSCSASRMVNE